MGCSPLAIHAYREPPFPDFYEVESFGVGQVTEIFRPLSILSVSLLLQHSLSRLDYGQFRPKPAISDLDWLITPKRKLEEYLHVKPLQASTKHMSRFTLPTLSSIGFGSHPCDFWHFHTISLITCGIIGFPAEHSSNRIILATKMHSLARYSERTIERLLRPIPLSLLGFKVF